MKRASSPRARGRLAGPVLRRRRPVAVFWLAVTVAGVLLAGQVTGRFSSTQELPGLPSYRAAEVQKSYGIGANPPVAVLLTLPGAGILLDATVVRALLLPALVSLFGRWNWWLPRPTARLLRVPLTRDTGAEPSETSDGAPLGSGSR